MGNISMAAMTMTFDSLLVSTLRCYICRSRFSTKSPHEILSSVPCLYHHFSSPSSTKKLLPTTFHPWIPWGQFGKYAVRVTSVRGWRWWKSIWVWGWSCCVLLQQLLHLFSLLHGQFFFETQNVKFNFGLTENREFVDKQIHAMQHQITPGHQLNHVHVVVHKIRRVTVQPEEKPLST